MRVHRGVSGKSERNLQFRSNDIRHFLKTRAVNSDAEQESNKYEGQPAFDDAGEEEKIAKDDNLCEEDIVEQEDQKTTTEEYLNNNKQQQVLSSNTPPRDKFKKQNCEEEEDIRSTLLELKTSQHAQQSEPLCLQGSARKRSRAKETMEETQAEETLTEE